MPTARRSQMNTLWVSAVPGKLAGGQKEMRWERRLRECRGRAKEQVVGFAGEEAAESPPVHPGENGRLYPQLPSLTALWGLFTFAP